MGFGLDGPDFASPFKMIPELPVKRRSGCPPPGRCHVQTISTLDSSVIDCIKPKYNANFSFPNEQINAHAEFTKRENYQFTEIDKETVVSVSKLARLGR